MNQTKSRKLQSTSQDVLSLLKQKVLTFERENLAVAWAAVLHSLFTQQKVNLIKNSLRVRLAPAVIRVIAMFISRPRNSVQFRKAACIGLTRTTSRRFATIESSRTYMSDQHSSNLRIHQKLWLQVICDEAAGCVAVVAFVVQCSNTWRTCFELNHYHHHH